jgi:ElaB/YqjD/DUF883 family membrane-anchored ribosome-binding protein
MIPMPKTTTDTKPLYAVAGVADLAVAALRELPARLPAVAERAENAAVTARAQISERLNEIPAEIEKLRTELPADVQKWRAELPTVLRDAQDKAQKYYAEMAIRGEGAVARFRREYAGSIEAVTSKAAETAEKAAETAEKAAETADKAADEINDAAPAKPAARKPRKATKPAQSAK